MDNSRDYLQNSDFASSGSDSYATITVSVPTHTLTAMTDREFTADVIVPSSYYGRQIRAQIQPSGIDGSRNIPSPYVAMFVNITWSGGDGQSYAFAYVSRVSESVVRLTVRTSNNGGSGGSITYPAFSVTARVRTVVAN